MNKYNEQLKCKVCQKLFWRNGQAHWYCSKECSDASYNPDALRDYNRLKQRESRARRKDEANAAEDI